MKITIKLSFLIKEIDNLLYKLFRNAIRFCHILAHQFRDYVLFLFGPGGKLSNEITFPRAGPELNGEYLIFKTFVIRYPDAHIIVGPAQHGVIMIGTLEKYLPGRTGKRGIEIVAFFL